MDKLHTTLVEGTELLQELAVGIADAAHGQAEPVNPTTPAPAEAATASDDPPRFTNDDLNTLAERVAGAEEAAREKLESQVKAETRRVRIETATSLCAALSKVLGRISAQGQGAGQSAALHQPAVEPPA